MFQKEGGAGNKRFLKPPLRLLPTGGHSNGDILANLKMARYCEQVYEQETKFPFSVYS